ncbi:MAG: cytidylate kinase-like family protein [Lachnospiraceae bacterium]|nr:cytidylate kinase-like family protein [Lachnospiraceae bacterium]MBR3761202.1 cytidylate kinase-like family protein [Lachnospiraceae bacterium]
MQNIVITIARQYGSGGRLIGKMLSEELGIPYYDRQLLQLASDDSGINEKLFAGADEKVKATALFRIAKKVYNGELIPPDKDDFVSNDNLFNYQAKIIKELAEEDSCVIIGRCADFVLKDYPNVISVFIHADEDKCAERIGEIRRMESKELRKHMADVDKRRGTYYKYYTGKEWSDARNYDICLDSGKLGYRGCVEAIKQQIKLRFGEE